ncbi:MAG: hypothetical protein HY567_01655 [Candidatus Kerfeldbacteria bacterium]|nr:hypothetical protein [Candidatus Kerfeldbacteria bacterium]
MLHRSTAIGVLVTVFMGVLNLWGLILPWIPVGPQTQAIAQGDGKIVYGEGTVTTPRTRDWASGAFGSEGNTVTAAATIRHVVIKASPTADEMIAGIQTTDGALYIQRWNGSIWSAEWNVTVGDGNLPRFDIAYEQSSGEALVVYGTNTGSTNEIAYRRWTGSSWVGPTNYDAVRTSGVIQGLAMVSLGGSSDLAMVWGDANLDLSANYWDGTNNVWKTEPSAALSTGVDTLAAATSLTTWSFDLEFESVSGELLIAWGNAATADVTYVTRGAGAAGSWGSVTTNTTFAEQSDDLELSADPNSNNIILVHTGSDSGNDMEAAVWTGSAFPASIDTAAPCAANVICTLDAAVDTTGAGTSGNAAGWLTSGSATRGIVVYDDANAAGLDWVVWDSTNGWALQTDCTTACNSQPASGDDKLHRIRLNPFNDAELMWIGVDTASDLFAKKLTFDGTNLTWSSTEPSNATLEATTSSITGFAADFAYHKFIPVSGSLSVDIVDASGASVASPSLVMNALTLSFAVQTATGTFGVSSQKIRVTNTTATATWTLSVAASATTAVWDSAGTDYDFNDPTANAGDGGDTDTVGGQMTVNASGATITPQTGCTTTGLTLGSSTAFNEGVTNSVTLITAGASAGTNCYWDLTSTSISQTVPEEQPVASDYNLNMVVSVVAS